MLIRLCLGLLAFAATTAPTFADELTLGENWLMDPLRWSVPPEGITSISVINHHGSVRVGGSSGPFAEAIELHGTVQHHVDDPRRPQIQTSQKDGLLTIEIIYPDDTEDDPVPDAWRKRRADTTFYIPSPLPLRVETIHGSSLIKGMSGKIEVHSESGNLELKTDGMVTARSNYGQISVTLTGEQLERHLDLETLTGLIDVSLPWELDPAATIETRGAITSDFSIDIQWLPDSTLKRGTIAGQASQPFVLRSNRGNVRLLRRAPALPTAGSAEND